MIKKEHSAERRQPNGNVDGELLPYEKQLALIYAWFFTMWRVLERNDGKAARNDGKAAKEARGELQSLFFTHVQQVLRLALAEKENETKQWAGMMLGNIVSSIWKHDEKLSETNKAYVAEKKKIRNEKQLVQVLFPKPISEVVQWELGTAERYRKRLRLLKAAFGKEWKQAARRQKISEAYFPTVALKEFSLKQETRWWKFLWPLIKKNNSDLLPKLRGRSNRAERVDPVDKKSGTRKIKPSWKHYRNEFRNALHTLARVRSGGVR